MKNKFIKILTEVGLEPEKADTTANSLLSLFGVSGSLPFNAIINPHYDKHSRIDGGLIISNGEIIGHADPIGEPGFEGVVGCNDH
jgi:hypothetical protein